MSGRRLPMADGGEAEREKRSALAVLDLFRRTARSAYAGIARLKAHARDVGADPSDEPADPDVVPDPPEAPVWLSAADAGVWQAGWSSGYRAAKEAQK